MIQQEYKDTNRACDKCEEGTYVLYPDRVIKCRYCGELETDTVPTKTVGRKANG